MIIDEDIVAGGVTPFIITKLIERHERERQRYRLLHDYYMGDHRILNRRKRGKNVANNRIMCNHAKYITDMTQSYLVGNPVTYAVSDEYDIEAIKNEYLEQDMPSVDSEIVKNMSIYGKAYELIYADEKSKPRSVRLDPEHTFVCYSQSAFEKPLFAVYYYKKYDLDGYCTGSICRVYDESFIYTYTGLDSYTALSLQNVEPHYFFDVPIIEYRNNTEMQGDFEQLITQIDAYNVLMSDRINDKEQFVNSLLFLCNCDLDTEQAKKLLVERILMGDGDAKAEYLSKVLNEADTKVLRDVIKDDIHRLSHVPDLSDESFGNNLSGVAIKYKLLGFEQHVKNKERNFAKTLRKRLEIYNNFLVTLNAMKEVPSHRVDIGFTYNLPANELEIAQMINYLKGLASDETLLERLPFITDAKEEVEIARREQAEKSAEDMRIAESSARKVNYNEE